MVIFINMLKKTFYLLIILLSITFLLSLFKIEKNTIQVHTVLKTVMPQKEIEQPIGRIIIPKIQIDKPLYDQDSTKNNIENNITILKESLKQMLI